MRSIEKTIQMPGEGATGTFTVTGDPELVRVVLDLAVQTVQARAAQLAQEFSKKQFAEQFIIRKPCEGCPD